MYQWDIAVTRRSECDLRGSKFRLRHFQFDGVLEASRRPPLAKTPRYLVEIVVGMFRTYPAILIPCAECDRMLVAPEGTKVEVGNRVGGHVFELPDQSQLGGAFPRCHEHLEMRLRPAKPEDSLGTH